MMDAAARTRGAGIVVLLLVLVAGLGVGAASTDAEGRLLYSLTEQQPVGTLVANVAADAGISAAAAAAAGDGGVRYFVLGDEPGPSLFRVDDDGLLWTRAVVDREELCPGRPDCPVLLDVAARRLRDAAVSIVKLHVRIVDVNDHAPAFPAPRLDFHVAESTAPGLLFPLPPATDPDSPANGIAGYATDIHVQLGHWVNGSVGHLGHLSLPGYRVILLTRCETRVFPVLEKKPKIKI